MGAIKDLFNSERGLLGVLLIIAATVLTGMGQMTIEAWDTFTKTIFITYVGGKTVTGGIALLKGTQDPPLPASTSTPATTTPTAPPLTATDGTPIKAGDILVAVAPK